MFFLTCTRKAVLSSGELVSASYDKTIRIWDTKTGFENVILKNSQAALSLAVLPTGELAAGSNDNMIQIYDASNWQVKQILQGHVSPIKSLVASQSGVLVSSSEDGKIIKWFSS